MDRAAWFNLFSGLGLLAVWAGFLALGLWVAVEIVNALAELLA